MREIKILVFFILTLTICFSGRLFAMSWPSEEAVLIRNFGSNLDGRPVLGMVFSGGTNIHAAENGTVIFTRNINDRASRLPSPLGAWKAVDHGDGLISIYSRFAEGQIPGNPNPAAAEYEYPGTRILPLTTVERNQPIAVAGVSGWSSQNGFYFKVYDRRERRWVNPAIIVTPHREIRQPDILSVEIRNAQGVPIHTPNLAQGHYTILVSANVSSAPRGAVFAPLRIVCSINGVEAGSLNFESFSARDGVLMAFRNGLVPVSQIFANYPAFETANVFFNRGQATLEILVQDVAGNTRSFQRRFFVN